MVSLVSCSNRELLRVFSWLDICSLLALREACRRLYELITYDTSLWRAQLARLYRHVPAAVSLYYRLSSLAFTPGVPPPELRAVALPNVPLIASLSRSMRCAWRSPCSVAVASRDGGASCVSDGSVGVGPPPCPLLALCEAISFEFPELPIPALALRPSDLLPVEGDMSFVACPCVVNSNISGGDPRRAIRTAWSEPVVGTDGAPFAPAAAAPGSHTISDRCAHCSRRRAVHSDAGPPGEGECAAAVILSARWSSPSSAMSSLGLYDHIHSVRLCLGIGEGAAGESVTVSTAESAGTGAHQGSPASPQYGHTPGSVRCVGILTNSMGGVSGEYMHYSAPFRFDFLWDPVQYLQQRIPPSVASASASRSVGGGGFPADLDSAIAKFARFALHNAHISPCGFDEGVALPLPVHQSQNRAPAERRVPRGLAVAATIRQLQFACHFTSPSTARWTLSDCVSNGIKRALLRRSARNASGTTGPVNLTTLVSSVDATDRSSIHSFVYACIEAIMGLSISETYVSLELDEEDRVLSPCKDLDASGQLNGSSSTEIRSAADVRGAVLMAALQRCAPVPSTELGVQCEQEVRDIDMVRIRDAVDSASEFSLRQIVAADAVASSDAGRIYVQDATVSSLASATTTWVDVALRNKPPSLPLAPGAATLLFWEAAVLSSTDLSGACHSTDVPPVLAVPCRSLSPRLRAALKDLRQNLSTWKGVCQSSVLPEKVMCVPVGLWPPWAVPIADVLAEILAFAAVGYFAPCSDAIPAATRSVSCRNHDAEVVQDHCVEECGGFCNSVLDDAVSWRCFLESHILQTHRACIAFLLCLGYLCSATAARLSSTVVDHNNGGNNNNAQDGRTATTHLPPLPRPSQVHALCGMSVATCRLPAGCAKP